MVADFGIALAASAAARPSGSPTAGLMLGTPAVHEPRAGPGEPDLDARSDVYSLACVLYELLAGEPPYTGAYGADGDRQAVHRAGALASAALRPAVPLDGGAGARAGAGAGAGRPIRLRREFAAALTHDRARRAPGRRRSPSFRSST